MDIYCGNLAYATTDDGLKAAFAAYGEVTSARVVTDRMTGRSKGFGFVEMPNAEQAEAAIAALNGSEMDGRPIRVNQSQPKPQDDRRGGGRGGFGFLGQAVEQMVPDIQHQSDGQDHGQHIQCHLFQIFFIHIFDPA